MCGGAALAGSMERAAGRGWHCRTAGGGPGWPTLRLSPSHPKAGGSLGGEVMARLGGTLPCWGLGAWRAEWCHPLPRASLGLLGMGRMVPCPGERGGACACAAACSVRRRGQLGGPRPCASVPAGPQVLGLLQPPRRSWCLPGPCLALGTLGEAMLSVLPGPLPHSREGGKPGRWSQPQCCPSSFLPPPQRLGAEEANPHPEGCASQAKAFS